MAENKTFADFIDADRSPTLDLAGKKLIYKEGRQPDAESTSPEVAYTAIEKVDGLNLPPGFSVFHTSREIPGEFGSTDIQKQTIICFGDKVLASVFLYKDHKSKKDHVIFTQYNTELKGPNRFFNQYTTIATQADADINDLNEAAVKLAQYARDAVRASGVVIQPIVTPAPPVQEAAPTPPPPTPPPPAPVVENVGNAAPKTFINVAVNKNDTATVTEKVTDKPDKKDTYPVLEEIAPGDNTKYRIVTLDQDEDIFSLSTTRGMYLINENGDVISQGRYFRPEEFDNPDTLTISNYKDGEITLVNDPARRDNVITDFESAQEAFITHSQQLLGLPVKPISQETASPPPPPAPPAKSAPAKSAPAVPAPKPAAVAEETLTIARKKPDTWPSAQGYYKFPNVDFAVAGEGKNQFVYAYGSMGNAFTTDGKIDPQTAASINKLREVAGFDTKLPLTKIEVDGAPVIVIPIGKKQKAQEVADALRDEKNRLHFSEPSAAFPLYQLVSVYLGDNEETRLAEVTLLVTGPANTTKKALPVLEAAVVRLKLPFKLEAQDRSGSEPRLVISPSEGRVSHLSMLHGVEILLSDLAVVNELKLNGPTLAQPLESKIRDEQAIARRVPEISYYAGPPEKNQKPEGDYFNRADLSIINFPLPDNFHDDLKAKLAEKLNRADLQYSAHPVDRGNGQRMNVKFPKPPNGEHVPSAKIAEAYAESLVELSRQYGWDSQPYPHPSVPGKTTQQVLIEKTLLGLKNAAGGLVADPNLQPVADEFTKKHLPPAVAPEQQKQPAAPPQPPKEPPAPTPAPTPAPVLADAEMPVIARQQPTTWPSVAGHYVIPFTKFHVGTNGKTKFLYCDDFERHNDTPRGTIPKEAEEAVNKLREIAGYNTKKPLKMLEHEGRTVIFVPLKPALLTRRPTFEVMASKLNEEQQKVQFGDEETLKRYPAYRNISPYVLAEKGTIQLLSKPYETEAVLGVLTDAAARHKLPLKFAPSPGDSTVIDVLPTKGKINRLSMAHGFEILLSDPEVVNKLKLNGRNLKVAMDSLIEVIGIQAKQAATADAGGKTATGTATPPPKPPAPAPAPTPKPAPRAEHDTTTRRPDVTTPGAAPTPPKPPAPPAAENSPAGPVPPSNLQVVFKDGRKKFSVKETSDKKRESNDFNLLKTPDDVENYNVVSSEVVPNSGSYKAFMYMAEKTSGAVVMRGEFNAASKQLILYNFMDPTADNKAKKIVIDPVNDIYVAYTKFNESARDLEKSIRFNNIEPNPRATKYEELNFKDFLEVDTYVNAMQRKHIEMNAAGKDTAKLFNKEYEVTKAGTKFDKPKRQAALTKLFGDDLPFYQPPENPSAEKFNDRTTWKGEMMVKKATTTDKAETKLKKAIKGYDNELAAAGEFELKMDDSVEEDAKRNLKGADRDIFRKHLKAQGLEASLDAAGNLILHETVPMKEYLAKKEVQIPGVNGGQSTKLTPRTLDMFMRDAGFGIKEITPSGRSR